jgi:hypothetical protein
MSLAPLTGSVPAVAEDHGIKRVRSPEGNKMLFTVSLLSSIAQSRFGQWLRAVTLLQKRVRYH